jgi:ABC-type branched-subunit amino acid transport system substrate-binding protein
VFEDPTPYEPPGRRQRRRRSFAALGLVAVVVLAGGGFGASKLVRGCGGLRSGVTEQGGECIGVTDGSYVFHPGLKDVEAVIKRSNDAIGSEPAVTVALVEAFTPDATSAQNVDEVARILRGAAIAQQEANQIPNGQRIRLVLANQGGHQDHWESVGRTLIGMTDDEAPLVAAAGMGVSTPQTERAARQLSAAGIPMVAAITTADRLTYTQIPGYFHVSALNKDYVRALRQYVDRRRFGSGVLVYDGNSDLPDNADLFTQTLRDDLDAEFGTGSRGRRALLRFSAQNFSGSLTPREGVRAIAFNNIVANLCANKPDVIFYAGRQHDLEAFLDALQRRSCGRQWPVTVVTAGSDLGALSGRADALRTAGITMTYAAATDPAGWRSTPSTAPAGFAAFRARYTAAGHDDRDLDDGNAISNYDAVLTVIRAVDLAGQNSDGRRPDTRAVLTNLRNLNGQDCVQGAGGTIAFGALPDQGTPVGKPIPVLTIPPDPRRSRSAPYVTRPVDEALACR